MTTSENVGRREYESDWDGHRQVHVHVDTRLGTVESDIAVAKQLQNDQLAELKDIKWLLLILIVGSLPRLIEFVKGLIHP